MKLLYTIALLTMMNMTSYAGERIEGAFGLKLGDTLDVNSDVVVAVDGFVNAVYEIDPPAPLDGFDHYLVYITPLTPYGQKTQPNVENARNQAYKLILETNSAMLSEYL